MITRAEISLRACIFNDTLQADDKRLNGSVFITHQDKSELKLRNAFVVNYADHFVIFTEHLGTFIFHCDDVNLNHYDHIESWD